MRRTPRVVLLSSFALAAVALVALAPRALATPLDFNAPPKTSLPCPANPVPPDFVAADGWKGNVPAMGILSASYDRTSNEQVCAYGELRPNSGGPMVHYSLRKAVPAGFSDCGGDGRFNDRIFCQRAGRRGGQ